jgi:hypothetical protein
MTEPASPADGRRFSQNYLNRGEPTDDSVRMRVRLAALIGQLRRPLDNLASDIAREQGVKVPYASYGYDWETFTANAAVRDILDLVTTAVKTIGTYDQTAERRERGTATIWINEVARIFREENVRYRVDNAGGVHFAIDDEFERNNVATLKALDGARHAATLANFESALVRLAATPPATKDAIRDVFSAAERLFRLMFPNAPRLTAGEADRQLAPIVQKQMDGDPASVGAAMKLLRGFKEWIDAAHFYRHEPGQAEPKAPPLEVAVLIVSGGAGWVRWLAEIDHNLQPKAA